MNIVAKCLIGLVILAQMAALIIEMFLWETQGKASFGAVMAAELFEKTTVLAANQGLYNGFLAAGLIWALTISDMACARRVALFFLGCVCVAGLYGTFGPRGDEMFWTPFRTQTIPSALAMAAILIDRSSGGARG